MLQAAPVSSSWQQVSREAHPVALFLERFRVQGLFLYHKATLRVDTGTRIQDLHKSLHRGDVKVNGKSSRSRKMGLHT